MTLVALLDRQRTRDRARPRPNAPGNYITDQRRATVYSLTFTPSPENYIKWWPYVFPETKAIGYIDNPPLNPDWIPLGPIAPINPIFNITDGLIPGGPGVGIPPPEVPDIGVPLPPIDDIGGSDPIDIGVPVVPAEVPVNVPDGATLTADTAHQAGRTFSSIVGLTLLQIQTSKFPIRGVTILADDLNGGDIFIGYDTQLTIENGFKLIPGSGKFFNIDNLSDIWMIATLANQKIHVEYTV